MPQPARASANPQASMAHAQVGAAPNAAGAKATRTRNNVAIKALPPFAQLRLALMNNLFTKR